MHCCFFFQEPILKIWLQIVVKAGAINFDALHQLLYLCYAATYFMTILKDYITGIGALGLPYDYRSAGDAQLTDMDKCII